jgi:hypothetical protein
METIVQFLRPRYAFMARGQRHEIRYVYRDGQRKQVFINGSAADGQYFEATFEWGETVDVLADTM